jgi:hypothetical protein
MKPKIKINFALAAVAVCLIFMQTEIVSQKKLEIDSAEKARRKDKLIKLNIKSFINRTNEKATEASRKADIEVGKKLAASYNADPTKAMHKGITVTRFESKEEGRFAGDVMEFTKKATFGHINAIVRVVSGYINGMYQYNQEDSELLALYVVYYNRKHRGDSSYVDTNFYENDVIMKDRLGIPEKFEGWSGQTQILIPIEKNLVKGGGFDIATFELEDQVNPDIDVTNQKKFAKLQTKKIKSEKEEVQQKYEEVLKKEKALLGRKKALEDKLAELMKDPEKNKAEIAKIQAEIKKVDKELEVVAIEKKELENKLEQIARREEMRKLGITSEKEYLAYLASQKKKEIPPTPPKDAQAEKSKPIEVEKPKPVLIEQPVVIANTPPKDLHFWQSFHVAEATIAGKESYQIKDVGILTIGYELPFNPRSELRVYLFGSGPLHLVRTSEGIKINSDSSLTLYEGKLFVFEDFQGKTYLTQLTPHLEFELRSSDPIDPNSTVSFRADTIILTKRQMTGKADDVLNFTRKDLNLVK